MQHRSKRAMRRSWRMWPCMPFSSVRASLTLTRPGGASTVGESQPTAEDPEEAGERMGWGTALAKVWSWEGAWVWVGEGGWPRRGEMPSLTRVPAHPPPPPPGRSSVPRRRANTSSLQLFCPVNSASSSEVRPRRCPPRPPKAPPPNLNPFLQSCCSSTSQRQDGS